MKATVSAKVTRKIAETLAETLIARFAKERGDWSCPYHQERHVFFNMNNYGGEGDYCLSDSAITVIDSYGAELFLKFPSANTIIAGGVTCSGTEQSVSIDIKSGRLFATHDGLRGSDLGWAYLLFVDQKTGDNLFQNFDWKISEVVSSQPNWAVYISAINQRFGNGPAFLYEAHGFDSKYELMTAASGFNPDI